MGNRARVLIVGLFAVLALVTMAFAEAMPAAAKTCYKNVVPPGASGTSQYVEVIPTTCGSATPPSSGAGGSAGSRPSGGSITGIGQGAAGVKRLSHMGAQGQAAARLAAATAPAAIAGSSGSPQGSTGSGKHGGSGHGLTGARSSGSRAVTVGPRIRANGSSAAALGDALAGATGNGLGTLLPVLLGVLLGAAIGTAVMRARRSSGPSI